MTSFHPTKRSSNLELYRIVCMLMIVAHHFVCNSGLNGDGSPMNTNPHSINTLYLLLLGAWGKTGINCFMMITGYFMCKSSITLRKYIKLFIQIETYNIIIYTLFFVTGYEEFSAFRIVKVIIPFWGFENNFVGCYLAFYLLIPFLSILVRNMTKRQHELLLLFFLCTYVVLGSIPSFKVSYNYITWFSIIFIIASYIRLYPNKFFENRKIIGGITFISIIVASLSILSLHWTVSAGYFFVTDCNKIFAVIIALSSFLFFKNMNIKDSKLINRISMSTFGVLLIHANSSAMRQWLWRDVFQCTTLFNLSIMKLVVVSLGGVICVFVACVVIDQIRIYCIEKPFLKVFDNRFS